MSRNIEKNVKTFLLIAWYDKIKQSRAFVAFNFVVPQYVSFNNNSKMSIFSNLPIQN